MEGELTTAHVVRLSANMRVVGLPRKSPNGTRFYIVDENQLKRRGGAPKGYCTLLRTKPDGTSIAQIDSGGTCISFNTKNTTVWPHGQKLVLKQPRRPRKKAA